MVLAAAGLVALMDDSKGQFERAVFSSWTECRGDKTSTARFAGGEECGAGGRWPVGADGRHSVR